MRWVLRWREVVARLLDAGKVDERAEHRSADLAKKGRRRRQSEGGKKQNDRSRLGQASKFVRERSQVYQD